MDSSFYNFPRYDIIENDFKTDVKFNWNSEGNLLVLVTKEFDNEELKVFLEKILAAIKANETNTCIVQILGDRKVKLIDLKPYLHCQSVICIGLNPSDIGLNIEFRNFDVKRINNRKVIFSPDLNELNYNVEYKKHLWAGLKEHFTQSDSE